MRRATIITNCLTAAFFSSFLAYTFLARPHLDGLARDFVTEKTIEYSKSVVDLADVLLQTPLSQAKLDDRQRTAIQDEIALYRSDPRAYVSDLTRQQERVPAVTTTNSVHQRVASLKEGIRMFYNNTLNKLIVDLRIFSVTNLVAGLIALGLAWRSQSGVRTSVVCFSLMIFIGVVYNACLYVDDLTFFRILFRLHMGWWYPVILCVTVIGLYRDYGRHLKEIEPDPAPNSRLPSQLPTSPQVPSSDSQRTSSSSV